MPEEQVRIIPMAVDRRRRALERTALQIVQHADSWEGRSCPYCAAERPVGDIQVDQDDPNAGLLVEKGPIQHRPSCPSQRLKDALSTA